MRDDARIKVLIAEDEAPLGALLEKFLLGQGHAVTTVHDGRAALEALRADAYDVALVDIVMPEVDGLEVLRQVREQTAPPEVVIITGNGTIETAIESLKLGAYDYLSKPYRMAEIDVLLRRAWEKRQLARENALLQSQLARLDGDDQILTHSPAMQSVLSVIERVAPSESPVLITGESGTGKDLVARAIHRLSARHAGPRVDLNCAALPEALLESELFGHERGAFDRADERKQGLLELANGGTVFLDQIGDLDTKVQGKLLRALELNSFYRLGGTQKVQADLRVVAATTDDLARKVGEGTFRGDLYYRINTISLTLPPLREREADIPLLAAHFLQRYGGASAPELSEEAMAALQRYEWPGNVRELRNVIERAVLLSSGDAIRVGDLPLPGALATQRPMHAELATRPLEQVERQHIELVLTHAGWHQGRAAEILGISPKTLYRKIREYGFRRPGGTKS